MNSGEKVGKQNIMVCFGTYVTQREKSIEHIKNPGVVGWTPKDASLYHFQQDQTNSGGGYLLWFPPTAYPS